MEAPSFWFDHYGFRASMLAPFGELYRLGAKLRRQSCKVPFEPSVPTICFGNIVVGGAGKTPTSIAVAKILIRLGKKVAFVSRGYKGSEQGPLLVDLKKHTLAQIGDEPLLLARVAPCWIGKNRAATLKAAAASGADVLLMDDGFQNPTVKAKLNLVVLDGGVGLGNGLVMPAGPLRETLEDATERADAFIFVGEDQRDLKENLSKDFFQAFMKLTLPEGLAPGDKCLAFTGIGRPKKFFASCEEAGLQVEVAMPFADHHLFILQELRNIVAVAKEKNLKIVTTEKDFVRLPEKFKPRAFALPLEIGFEDEAALTALLQSSIEAAR